jgi:eukaryotic-like serine/threonine-protein kinase
MDPELVRLQLDRMLNSTAFAGADRSSRFLRFVIERTLAGRAQEIKESVIGVEVLGRNPSFDPKTDPIVRAEAGRLRSRLESYYQTEGRDDRVRIALPKGGYAPEFSEYRQPKPAKTLHPFLLLAGGVALGIATTVILHVVLRRSPQPSPPLRLSVIPPRGTSVVSSVISPDGRRIAFTATSEGKTQMWVRELDSVAPKVLPGTDEASFPFWSPDSRYLGFFGRGGLERIAISGGPAQVITAAHVAFGGAWNAQDVIVYPPWPSGGLYQVTAAGGAPKPATVLDNARGEFAHYHPSFLPDGRHFLFFAVSSPSSQSSIRAGSLESTNSKYLLNADGAAVYAPVAESRTGFLVYVYGGALMAQPFDPDRLELKGHPTLVVPGIASLSGRGDFSVSTTGILAYRTADPKNRQLAWFDREGRRLETVGPRNSYSSWNLSPDEKRLATAYQETPRGGGIWTMDLSRGTPSLLTCDAREDLHTPVWSPDGGAVMFGKDDMDGRVGSEPAMSLERETLDARNPTTVLRGPGPKFLSDCSSDGRFVTYFTPWPEWNHLNVFIVDLSRGAQQTPRQFAPSSHSLYGAAFSPESTGPPRWVAYISDETGREEVYVGNFPTGDLKKVPISTDGGRQPHWRRDGRELFYLSPDATLMAVNVKAGRTFEAGRPRALFHTTIPPPLGPPNVPTNNYAPSQDGSRFLINQLIEESTPTPITIVTSWLTLLKVSD